MAFQAIRIERQMRNTTIGERDNIRIKSSYQFSEETSPERLQNSITICSNLDALVRSRKVRMHQSPPPRALDGGDSVTHPVQPNDPGEPGQNARAFPFTQFAKRKFSDLINEMPSASAANLMKDQKLNFRIDEID